MGANPKKRKTIRFRNNKNESLFLAENLTIKDLVKMGMKKLVLIPKEQSRLPDGWWRSA